MAGFGNDPRCCGAVRLERAVIEDGGDRYEGFWPDVGGRTLFLVSSPTHVQIVLQNKNMLIGQGCGGPSSFFVQCCHKKIPKTRVRAMEASKSIFLKNPTTVLFHKKTLLVYSTCDQPTKCMRSGKYSNENIRREECPAR